MDVFDFRSRLIEDYGSFVQSFITIRDDRIREHVDQQFRGGAYWPEALVQLNPAFEPGGWVDELVSEGLLAPECSRIFRVGKDAESDGKPLRLHRHQAEAIRAAATGRNYVLTTGTGSGKSLAYIIPIVNHILRRGSGKGVQAIIVYPMNALANSQEGELEKFLGPGLANPHVSFARYTGQEKEDVRADIIRRRPDILLTNYVMLELMLTRPREREGLISAARGLSFLVLDELHTYRGRQGADVSMLVRRVRQACEAKALQCVGTSATLAGPGTIDAQRAEVAKVATRLFGSPVAPAQVITETLRRATEPADDEPATFTPALQQRLSDPDRRPPSSYADFVRDPLAVWVESTFGVTREDGSGRLIRTTPIAVTGSSGAASLLAQATGAPEPACAAAIQETLLAGHACRHPETNFPVFAFRLHQFVSKGDTVYATPEGEADRYVTLRGQRFAPTGGGDKVLFPVLFCRECGREYFSVWRKEADEHGRVEVRFLPRPPDDREEPEEPDLEPGYLFIRTDEPWPDREHPTFWRRLPDDWQEATDRGSVVRRAREGDLPVHCAVRPDGRDGGGVPAAWIPGRFRFCLACGVSYTARQKSDFGKLGSLGTEGRATATTVISLAAVRRLRAEASLTPNARKLLSFTDNRQDASLQAGHFNDFVFVGLLRAALYAAVRDAGDAGIGHAELPGRIFDALALPLSEYAREPDVKFRALKDTEQALRDFLAYRVYCDLQRGWRITLPNLEQCGLLRVDYESLDELCEAEDVWSGGPWPLVTAAPETRARIARVLLDYMRRGLAIRVEYLEDRFQEGLRQRSNQRLTWPWALDDEERMVHASVLYPRSRREDEDYRGDLFLSPRGAFGIFLRRPGTFDRLRSLDTEGTRDVILALLKAMRVAGLVEVVHDHQEPDEVGYQVPAAAFVWRAGAGEHGFHDPVRQPNAPEAGLRVNPYFVDYYRRALRDTTLLEAREHTAQVQAKARADREDRFRSADLPILYCSPTMELGVDIKDLNVVHLRNVPPTPANYAQRSGRAGRSGQPAAVLAYCAAGSPHDQYYFRRPRKMVAGKVATPRIDLANEDLIRAHVHALWLAETGVDLRTSLRELLEIEGESPTLTLRAGVREDLERPEAAARATEYAQKLLETIGGELVHADWYTDGWLEAVLRDAPHRLDEACERWRDLYRSATRQRDEQNRVIGDASRSPEDKKRAKVLRAQAETQIELLLSSDSALQSDFYSYRYFASEGFLPGYNFPRLPLTAYLPGTRRKKGDEEYISRPRFLAISEFGPHSLIYHEGERFEIYKTKLRGGDKEDVGQGRAKLCDQCGYLHDEATAESADICGHCGVALPPPMPNLFRLANVDTRRRDRITSDEEERLRIGYEIRTAYRFVEHGRQPSRKDADIFAADGTLIARLAYGPAAKLWRLNFGWRARADSKRRGFPLDLASGNWGKDKDLAGDREDAPVMGKRVARVVPFVEDHRNALVLTPAIQLSSAALASLQYALKRAIQACFHLEDAELATEALPTRRDRRAILFYEAAEGGAGVLRRIVENPAEIPDIARNALDICHFDPGTAADLAEIAADRDACVAACYDCLLSYSNQWDHGVLDRRLIRDVLVDLAKARVVVRPSAAPRLAHLDELLARCDAELERRFLAHLQRRGHRLPSAAQRVIRQVGARPDFFYDGDFLAAVYVDGAIHESPERRRRDAQQLPQLERLGVTVLRFGAEDDWDALLRAWPALFGEPTEVNG